jgi:uncharacterized membrane protein YjfL (UPF0719 family)
MELTSFTHTIYFLGLNLLYALIALVVSSIAIVLLDKYLFQGINFIEEIKKGNIAAAIFYSTTLIFAGLVVATAIS